MNKNIRRLLPALLLCAAAQTAMGQQTQTLYLSGHDADHTVAWDFRCSKGMQSGKWRKIHVPSCWELQGFGEYTYGRYYKKPGGRVSDETGLYRHTFKVPASWKGKRVELVMEGVMTDASVTVNGQRAGKTHQGGFTAFSYDISRLIDCRGKNTLEVEVSKQSADRSVNAAERRADWWLFGGIYRPVYLRALPKTCLSRVETDAQADGTLRMRLHTENLAAGYRLEASLPGQPVKTLPLGTGDVQTVQTRWNGIKTWDPEHPRLYTLTLRLVAPDGTVAHEVTERVGFRTVEFRPRDGFYLNGTKLLVKGINRHCFYPETGRATSRERDVADVKLIKAMNANAIRSHYPPDNHLLDICDSLGVLYFCELPGWQNHYADSTGRRILQEMMAADANHPCIFAWGNGNEGGFNLSLDPLFAEYDLQRRHVVHPWAKYDGVDAHHYPAYQTGVARLHNGYEVFMPTEFLHSQYDKGGGASLDDYWSHWMQNPLFAGGFIWAWVDEGVRRTDQGGRIDNDGTNAPDGVVGPHREREASWYTIRDVWSPLQIAPVAVRPQWDKTIRIDNGQLFSSLDEVKMRYEVLSLPLPDETAERSIMEQGELQLPDAAPGERVKVEIPIQTGRGDVLRLTALRADGDTMNVWTWPMKYADEYWQAHRPLAGKQSTDGQASVSGTTLLSASGIQAVFDPQTGLLAHLYNNGREIPFNNGPVPVGMKMKLKKVTSRMEGNDALLVMHYTGAADSIVWRMTADGLLGMDAVILDRKDGGRYEGEFFDREVRNLGFSFSYPESAVKGMRWLGRGPYRVWRNRQRGTLHDIWQKDYNNTVTGQPEADGRLVYPEFKGYHANLYWAEMLSDTAPMTVGTETDGLYYRVFTPEEPRERNNGEHTMQPFPEGDLSFLLEIPGIKSYKPIEQLGPQAQPSHIRINKGDDGLRIKLWFDFNSPVQAVRTPTSRRPAGGRANGGNAR